MGRRDGLRRGNVRPESGRTPSANFFRTGHRPSVLSSGPGGGYNQTTLTATAAEDGHARPRPARGPDRPVAGRRRRGGDRTRPGVRAGHPVARPRLAAAAGHPAPPPVRLDGRLPVGPRQLLRPGRRGAVRPRPARATDRRAGADRPAQAVVRGAEADGPAAGRAADRWCGTGRRGGRGRGPHPECAVRRPRVAGGGAPPAPAEERRIADRRAEGGDWAAIAAELGGTPDGRRMQLARALDRVTEQLGLDEPDGDPP